MALQLLHQSSQHLHAIHQLSRPSKGLQARANIVCQASKKASQLQTNSQSLCRRHVIGLLAASWPCFPKVDVQAAIVDEEVTERVFNAAAASVVSVVNNRKTQDGVVEDSVGSGFVWDARGYIVTNYHCVQATQNDQTGKMFTIVRTGLPGESAQEFDAEILRTDADHDLAVLKLDVPPGALIPAKIGTSADLRIGQSVYAIGSPYGLAKTFTCGVVSGLNRGIPTPGGAIATGAIQTDASINQGNSGGPLLDSSGRLIGISTATFSSNKSMGRGSGVNFAISVDTLRSVVPNLIVYGNAYGRA